MRFGVLFLLLVSLFLVACSSSSYEYVGEDLFLTTSDGVRLAATYTPASDPRVTAILVHDSGGTQEDWTQIVDWFSQNGVSTLTFDLRGHGNSDGGVDYTASVLDVAAAQDFLADQGSAASVLVGSNVGSHIALMYAGDDARIVKVLAYGMRREWQGLEITKEVLDAYDGELYLFVAKAHNPHWEETVAIKEYFTGPVKMRLYTGAYDGFAMVNQNFGDAMDLSLGWIYREV